MNNFKKYSLETPHDVYDDALYSGLEGFVMDYGHKLLESSFKSGHPKIVLEVGPGSKPHIQWMNCETKIDKYILLDSADQLKHIKSSFSDKCKVVIKIPLNNKEKVLSFEGRVDRVIANHVLEHLQDPEAFILEMTRLLSDNGVISIGLPCDPGILWRFGQIFSMKRATKIYGYSSKEEKDLMWSRQHINAIQRLLAIIRFYYKSQTISYFPLKVPSVNLNLLAIIHLKRSDFRFHG
jgi:phosphatidylethanolamine/phosphatidyl-N-methylethanolamine N-methyltransferase